MKNIFQYEKVVFILNHKTHGAQIRFLRDCFLNPYIFYK